MSDYPPNGNDSAPARLARQDSICDCFEAAWKAGHWPHLERYLGKVPPSEQPDLLRELLSLELSYRYQNGEKPQLEEYHRRFPPHGELIDTAFSEVRQATPRESQPTHQPFEPRVPDVAGTVREQASPSSETLALTVLGDYELLDQLGKGGMGVVYRARQRSANRIVALKIIRPDRLEQLSAEERQEWLERFRREAQIAACLEHDHVVPVYEVGQVEGQHFYSMHFVEGQSLAEILRAGPVPNHRAAIYLEQVARALHALHLRGIVHRDLKPRNILVDANDRPFVTDFGLAKGSEYTRGLTHLGTCVGTPEYMAPEQARNPAGVRPASDVYSLGATLYALLTGRPPFQAAEPVETLRQVRDEEPLSPRRLNPAVHRDLELICLKCLEKEPRKRYASAEQVAEELRRYRSGEPLRHTRAVGKAERVWRWCRRKPALAAVSSLALVALMATVIVFVQFVMYRAGVFEKQQLQLAELALEKGLTKCMQGEVSEGMLWLAHGLESAPADARDLHRVAKVNLGAWRRLLSPLRGVLPHDERVMAVAFSRDGQTIFTATSDKAQLWEAATGRPMGQPLALQGEVLAAAFSPDGKTILTGGEDSNARLWEAATGQPIGQPLQHGDKVEAVAFSADGKTIHGQRGPYGTTLGCRHRAVHWAASPA